MKIGDVVRIVLWATPTLLQGLIAILMVRRRLVRLFPFFFSYCVYVPARDLALWLVRSHPDLYAWIYWVGEWVSILLQFVVISEVFWYLTAPYEFVRSLARKIFKAMVLIAVLQGALLLALVVITPEMKNIDAILLVERSARILQVIVLILVMGFISRMGLTWHHYATGILLGSGIAGLQLVPSELATNLHLISNDTFIWLKPAIYNVAVVGWAAYFFPVRSRRVDLDRLPETDLSRWERTLKEYLRRK